MNKRHDAQRTFEEPRTIEPRTYKREMFQARIRLHRRSTMLRFIVVSAVIAGLLAFPAVGQTGKSSSQADQNAIVITFKDGHQQSFSLADVARIEFKTVGTTTTRSSASFAGRWKSWHRSWQVDVLHHPRPRRQGIEEHWIDSWPMGRGRRRGTNQLGRRLARRDSQGGKSLRESGLCAGQIVYRPSRQHYGGDEYGTAVRGLLGDRARGAGIGRSGCGGKMEKQIPRGLKSARKVKNKGLNAGLKASST